MSKQSFSGEFVAIGVTPDGSNRHLSGMSSGLRSVPVEQIHLYPFGICFSIADAMSAALSTGIKLPPELIDIRVEMSLLCNGRITLYKSDMHQMLSLLNITHIYSSKRAEMILNDLITIWAKIEPDVIYADAVSRGLFCTLCAKINARGIPVAIDSTDENNMDYARALINHRQEGRIYSPSLPFSTITGRNTSSSNSYPLSLPKKLRHWVSAPEESVLILLDYKRQEFGIAAALSDDPKMISLYRQADPYAFFAEELGQEVPAKIAKQAMIALQYGASIHGLSSVHSNHSRAMRDAWLLHRKLFSQYWNWTDTVIETALIDRVLSVPDGWKISITDSTSENSIINWPTQAIGAYLMRQCIKRLAAANIHCVGIQHDAFLIEAPTHQAARIQGLGEQILVGTSLDVLDSVALQVDSTFILPHSNLLR